MEKACNCRGSPAAFIGPDGVGWEGTAIIQHGTHLMFGCLQFVFSVVESNANVSKEGKTESNIKPEVAITTILKESFNTSILRSNSKPGSTPNP